MEIAVGALSGMVDALPAKLGDLLQQEYTLLSGVRGDVGFLQSELVTMNAALLRCESLESPDIQTRAWIVQVRDLAYDIEDWIDLFVHRRRRLLRRCGRHHLLLLLRVLLLGTLLRQQGYDAPRPPRHRHRAAGAQEPGHRAERAAEALQVRSAGGSRRPPERGGGR